MNKKLLYRFPIINLVCCSLLLFMHGSCGYHLRGHGSSLPEHIKNIYVPVFENDSIRYGLEIKVTDEVKQEIINFGYKIVKNRENADAELKGKVTKYQTFTERLDRSAKTESLRIYITLEVKFEDLIKERVLFENANYRSPGITFTIPDDPEARYILEEEKINDTVEELADQLVQEIFTGF